jgi:hypothetical protein
VKSKFEKDKIREFLGVQDKLLGLDTIDDMESESNFKSTGTNKKIE